jgi:hypothetical protein
MPLDNDETKITHLVFAGQRCVSGTYVNFSIGNQIFNYFSEIEINFLLYSESQCKFNLNDIIIDGTGAASRPLLKKKAELEALGYETMMIMIWVSPITSLERNANRDRALLPGIVLRTWRDINKNIETYKQEFGDNLVIINNNPNDAETNFDPEEIKRRFFDTSKAKGKPKSPEEIVKAKSDREELNKSIQQLVQQTPEFTPSSEAINKIKAFIK